MYLSRCCLRWQIDKPDDREIERNFTYRGAAGVGLSLSIVRRFTSFKSVNPFSRIYRKKEARKETLRFHPYLDKTCARWIYYYVVCDWNVKSVNTLNYTYNHRGEPTDTDRTRHVQFERARISPPLPSSSHILPLPSHASSPVYPLLYSRYWRCPRRYPRARIWRRLLRVPWPTDRTRPHMHALSDLIWSRCMYIHTTQPDAYYAYVHTYVYDGPHTTKENPKECRYMYMTHIRERSRLAQIIIIILFHIST